MSFSFKKPANVSDVIDVLNEHGTALKALVLQVEKDGSALLQFTDGYKSWAMGPASAVEIAVTEEGAKGEFVSEEDMRNFANEMERRGNEIRLQSEKIVELRAALSESQKSYVAETFITSSQAARIAQLEKQLAEISAPAVAAVSETITASTAPESTPLVSEGTGEAKPVESKTGTAAKALKKTS